MKSLLLVTCSEPDAIPFLRSLSADELTETTLVATRNVLCSAKQQTALGGTSLIGGLSTLDPARRLATEPGVRITIVIGRDPLGPFNGKGFVRARLLAPWVMTHEAHADLVELRPSGRAFRTRRHVTRKRLAVILYVREAALLAKYLAQSGLGRPVQNDRVADTSRAVANMAVAPFLAAFTLLRLIPFLLWTEVRARRARRPR